MSNAARASNVARTNHDSGDEDDAKPLWPEPCPICGRSMYDRWRTPLEHWTQTIYSPFEAAALDPNSTLDYETLDTCKSLPCRDAARRFSDMQRVDPHQRRFRIAMRVSRREHDERVARSPER